MADIKLTLLTIKQKREKLQFLRMFAIQKEKILVCEVLLK